MKRMMDNAATRWRKHSEGEPDQSPYWYRNESGDSGFTCQHDADAEELADAALVALALASPVLAPRDPLEQSFLAANQGPSEEYWLGTDAFGRDVLSRVLVGARVSLAIGICAPLLSALFGVWFGMAAPAKTPRALIDKLNRESNRVLGLPDVKKRFDELGLEIQGGTPEEFGRLMSDDEARWSRAVKRRVAFSRRRRGRVGLATIRCFGATSCARPSGV